MPTSSYAVTELKYAASSSWTSGKARQGVYSSTRYEGAIKFDGLSALSLSNIAISQIQLKLTFARAGGDSTKNLTFYRATSNTISGSVGSMRGASIGAISVTRAYDRSITLTFNDSTNAGQFNTLRSYFLSGYRVLIIYVPSTRGSYGSYCYDYLQVNDATLTLSYEYLQSDGYLSATSVAAGSAARLNITAYNSSYSHKVSWVFGSYSAVQTIAAGTSYASYTIPMTWLNAIPSATSGSATVTLETLDTGGASLGSYTYWFTITVPSSVVPTISGLSASPVNTNSTIAGWGIYVYGKSQAKITLSGAAGNYGSTIKSYSITTSPNVGSASAATFTTSTLYNTGTISVTATITDSRGRTASISTTFYVYAYSAPYFSSVTSYRCTSTGARDDASGTYAYIRAYYSCTALTGSNTVTIRVTLEQIGGSYKVTYGNINSGSGYLLGAGNLAADASYLITLQLTDTVGTMSTYTITIQSAAYLLHFKIGGKAIGIGKAAGDDNTISLGWPLKLTAPLEVTQGGTGANTPTAACSNIGAVSKTGDTMTGNLIIQSNLYPSMYLQPTYNNTTNRTVFEGSYVGASSFASWEDSTGNNRRMLEVRTATYAPSMDNAVVLRSVVNGSYYTYRMFHAGMATPVPVANGGTGASNGKTALNNLGIFYSASLPSSGTDGQICLVPV